MPAPDFAALRAFRTDLHGYFPRRADALIELIDALVTAGPVASLPQLSLQGTHRRGWGSLDDALAEGRLNIAALLGTLAQYRATDRQPVYAVDLSVWPRCDAETSPDRGFYYHPCRHSARQPIVAGWAYQWLAQLSFTPDSSIPPRTPTPSRWSRSGSWGAGYPVAARRRCSSSTPATTRPN